LTFEGEGREKSANEVMSSGGGELVLNRAGPQGRKESSGMLRFSGKRGGEGKGIPLHQGSCQMRFWERCHGYSEEKSRSLQLLRGGKKDIHQLTGKKGRKEKIKLTVLREKTPMHHMGRKKG